MHPAQLYGGFRIIFFCLVSGLLEVEVEVENYTLSRKKDTKLIHGGIGSTWERSFYMGMQNGSKNEI